MSDEMERAKEIDEAIKTAEPHDQQDSADQCEIGEVA